MEFICSCGAAYGVHERAPGELCVDIIREPSESDPIRRIEELETQLIIYRACANGMALSALESLIEMTGSFNEENPWLGVTAAVALRLLDTPTPPPAAREEQP